jgi:hypothetical protein
MIDMTKEQKELLLRDLCARLPYRVVVDYAHNAFDVHKGHYVKNGSKCILNCYLLDTFISPRQNENGEYIKPYLFPLSSMTEEQYEKFIIISGWDGDIKDIRRGKFSCIGYIGLDYIYDTIDWLNKNHFDYRGLIPKGLAIDATGLNIY